MSNINPSGIDFGSGQNVKVNPTDILVDSAGNPIIIPGSTTSFNSGGTTLISNNAQDAITELSNKVDGLQPANCSAFLGNIAAIDNTISNIVSQINNEILQITSIKIQLSNVTLSQADRDALNAEIDAIDVQIASQLQDKLTQTNNLITETENYRLCKGWDFALAGPGSSAPPTPYMGYSYYNTDLMLPTWFDGYEYLSATGTFPGTDFFSNLDPRTYQAGVRNGTTAISTYQTDNATLPTKIFDLGLDSTFNAQFNLITKTTPDRTILYQQYPILNQGVVGRYIFVFPTDSAPTFYAETDVANALATL